jgi:hypothetical protein
VLPVRRLHNTRRVRVRCGTWHDSIEHSNVTAGPGSHRSCSSRSRTNCSSRPLVSGSTGSSVIRRACANRRSSSFRSLFSAMAPFPFIYDGIAPELFILGLDFRLVIEPGYLTVALPKLDVMAINKLLGLLFGVSIVAAFEWNRIEEMPIHTDNIDAILCHHRGVRGLGDDNHSSILAAVSACWARRMSLSRSTPAGVP